MTELARISARIRSLILETAVTAGKGHLGGALSCTDILTTLYHGKVLRVDPKHPLDPDRDRFILSKGHSCLALYAILADLGFFDAKELSHFCADGSRLAGHPSREIPGIEADTGSLGHGLSIGVGMALAAKLDARPWRVTVLLGDGECHEGSVWEACQFAGHHRLSNLTVIIDRNGQCVLDRTEDCLRLEPLEARLGSFGFAVVRVDGHDQQALGRALRAQPSPGSAPLAVIADTIKGKGVSFMEGQLKWHHGVPQGRELEIARGELACTPQEVRS